MNDQLDLVPQVDILEALKWIKDAVDRKGTGLEALTSYFLKDGYIHAYNGRMVVGTPFPFPSEIGPVLVPAMEFERVLNNKPDGAFEWLLEPDRLVLKRGRFKGRIKKLLTEDWMWPVGIPQTTQVLPLQLVDAFETVLPFVSENATKPWATCAAIVGGTIQASNNVVIVEAPCDALDLNRPAYLVPRWVLEFVCKRREGLRDWLCEDNHITFTWHDGSWMRSGRVDDQFPDIRPVMEKYFVGEPDVEITPAWRKAIIRVCKITDDAVVRLREDSVISDSGEVLSVEDDAGTPCPEGLAESVWDIRFLKDVLEAATHWNPRLYPAPAPWVGNGIRGIIMGRRTQ